MTDRPLTPDEIAEKRFRPVWRGWEPAAVTAFLERVAEEHAVVLDELLRCHVAIDELERALELATRPDPSSEEIVTRR